MVYDSEGRLKLTTSDADLSLSGGFAHDPDGLVGAIAVASDSAPGVGHVQSGGWRTAEGQLIFVTAAFDAALPADHFKSGGEVRDPQGRVVVVSQVADSALTAGTFHSNGLRDPKGRRIVTGL